MANIELTEVKTKLFEAAVAADIPIHEALAELVADCMWSSSESPLYVNGVDYGRSFTNAMTRPRRVT